MHLYVDLSYSTCVSMFSSLLPLKRTVQYLSRVDCSTKVTSGKKRSVDSTRSFEGDDDSFLCDIRYVRSREATSQKPVAYHEFPTLLSQRIFHNIILIIQNEVRRRRHPCSCLFGIGLCPCPFCQRKFDEERC